MPLPEPVLAILPQAAAAIAAVALGRLTGPWRGPLAGWTAALPLAGGAAAAAGLLYGWNGWAPANVDHRALLLAIPAAVVGLAAAVRWRFFVPAALLHVAIALPLLMQVSMRGWGGGQSVLWLLALGLPWLGLILAARATAERLPGAGLAAWAGTLAVAGYALADPGASAIHGFACAGAGVAAGLVALACVRWGGRLQPGAAAAVIAATAPMWWLLTHSLAWRGDQPIIPAVALVPFALAPLAAWAAWPLRARPWLAGVVAVLAGAAVAAIAIALFAAPPPPDASGW